MLAERGADSVSGLIFLRVQRLVPAGWGRHLQSFGDLPVQAPHRQGHHRRPQRGVRGSRAAQHLAEWRRQQTFCAACLVYLIVGDSMTDEVSSLRGRWLPAGMSLAGKGSVPEAIDLIIPDAAQVSELLGKDACEALISLQVDPEGAPASDIDKLAVRLTSDGC